MSFLKEFMIQCSPGSRYVILDWDSFPKSLTWTKGSYPAPWTSCGHWIQSTRVSCLNSMPETQGLARRILIRKQRGREATITPWSGPIFCPVIIYPYPDSWNRHHRNVMARSAIVPLSMCSLSLDLCGGLYIQISSVVVSPRNWCLKPVGGIDTNSTENHLGPQQEVDGTLKWVFWKGKVNKWTVYKGTGRGPGASNRSCGCHYHLGLTKDGQAFDIIPTGKPPLPRQSVGWRRMERGSEGQMEAIQHRTAHSDFAGIQTRVLCFDLWKLALLSKWVG